MERSPVRYVVLRDRRVWEDGVDVPGLQPETDGVLTLARVPGTTNDAPIIQSSPSDVAPSGIAVGSQGDVYLSITDDHSVLWVMGACGENRYIVRAGTHFTPDTFNSPRGLTIASECLYVADSGNARVLVFDLPTLDRRAVWQGALQQPTCLDHDSTGRIYVLDAGLNRILRFDATGTPDAAYNQTMSQHAATLTQPIGFAVGAGDVLFVSDRQTNRVVSFDVDGALVDTLPASGGPQTPRALAAHGERLYAACAASGLIHVYEAAQGWLGFLRDYRGPVSALGFDTAGRLYIKPGLDDAYEVLDGNAAFVASGALIGGPFDAGDMSEWERVNVNVDLPAGTSAELRLFAAPPSQADPSMPANHPTNADWTSEVTLAPSLDTLVWPPTPGQPARSTGRYLWLRITLSSSNAHVSPRLRQVQAATTGTSYLEHLPAVYVREDGSGEFLARWLAWFRAELGDWDQALDDMPRHFDAATTPEGILPWLAQWLAFTLPQGKDAEEWRRLLTDVHRLYERRGTPFGVREFCELYTGARPLLFEAFRDRHLWQLGGASSRLGFDTTLAPALPDGMIVPGFTYADPAFMGLRGDYYGGTNFDRLRFSRIDGVVNRNWQLGPPVPDAIDNNAFSIRWTGQVRPRYTEVHTFRVASDDGVRLWVNGRLLIDEWLSHGETKSYGQIALTGGRWYPITLEYFALVPTSGITLSWASRSQRGEVIPQECLYAFVDEGAGAPQSDGSSSETMLVGQTVVGDSGPLVAADFGTPLYNDTAHLFTVLVPAASLPTTAQRERLKQIVDEEKPAHTDFHLCFAEARMRVGFQARIGIDAIVADTAGPMALGETSLGLDSVLAGTVEPDRSSSNDGLESRRTRW